MADNDRPDTVSQEAHQRIVTERDELKTKVEQLEATTRDLYTKDKALSHFLGQEGVDPKTAPKWAEMAVPFLREASPEEFTAKLQAQFEGLIPTVPGADSGGDPADNVPTVDTNPTPAFATPSPADGGTPLPEGDTKKFSYRDPEFQDALRRNDQEWIKNMDEAGRIIWRSEASMMPS